MNILKKLISFSCLSAPFWLQVLSVNIFETLQANPEISTFSGMLSSEGRARISEAMSDPSRRLTLFVPTNQAFIEFPQLGQMSSEELTNLVLYHIAAGQLASSSNTLQFVPTLATAGNVPQMLGVKGAMFAHDESATASVSGVGGVVSTGTQTAGQGTGAMMFHDGRKTIMASGVGQYSAEGGSPLIYTINTVLSPPRSAYETLAAISEASQLCTMVRELGLQDYLNQLGSGTLFIPSDFVWTRTGVQSSKEWAQNFLMQLYLPGTRVFSTSITSIPQIYSSFQLRSEGGLLYVNQGRIVRPDILAQNVVYNVVQGWLPSNIGSIQANVSLGSGSSTQEQAQPQQPSVMPEQAQAQQSGQTQQSEEQAELGQFQSGQA